MARVRAVAVRIVVAALIMAAAAAAWALSGLTAVYVGGNSMSPTLIAGDLVIARKAVSGVRAGDVVLALRPGWRQGVVHRVVSVGFDGRLQLRGDANPTPDLDPVPIEDVRGVLVTAVPTGRLIALLEALVRMVQSRLT